MSKPIVSRNSRTPRPDLAASRRLSSQTAPSGAQNPAGAVSILPGKDQAMQATMTLGVTEDQLETLTQALEEAWPALDRTSEEKHELYDKLTALADEHVLIGEDD